jgi:general secretion pathway protein C
MKRWPLLASFVLFLALCASATYWALQLFKPAPRPVAAAPQVVKPELKLDAAAGLFGGRAATFAVASNFQLKGVVVANRASESVAIVSADGKPGQAVGVDAEVMPGVTVKEVNAQYVLLSEGGVIKRVELAESAKSQGRMDMGQPLPPTAPPPAPVPPPAQPAQPPTAPATQTMVPTTVVGDQVPPPQATIPGNMPQTPQPAGTGVRQRPNFQSGRRGTQPPDE